MTAISEPSGEGRDEHTDSVMQSKEWLQDTQPGGKEERKDARKNKLTKNPSNNSPCKAKSEVLSLEYNNEEG